MKELINKYISLVTELKKSIISLQSSQYAENHKRTLILSLIDMMSRVTDEKRTTNKERFVKFVNEFCEWKHSTYVSLPQLKILIDKENSRGLDQIKSFTSEKLAKWPLNESVLLEYDAEYKVVEPLCPKGFKLMGKINLTQLRHCELLWTYRNSYVHEMRAPGQEYKLYKTDSPHYTPVFPLKWELVYPFEFLLDMTDHAICNLKRYLVKHKVNPFDKYKFEYSWLELR